MTHAEPRCAEVQRCCLTWRAWPNICLPLFPLLPVPAAHEAVSRPYLCAPHPRLRPAPEQGHSAAAVASRPPCSVCAAPHFIPPRTQPADRHAERHRRSGWNGYLLHQIIDSAGTDRPRKKARTRGSAGSPRREMPCSTVYRTRNGASSPSRRYPPGANRRRLRVS